MGSKFEEFEPAISFTHERDWNPNPPEFKQLRCADCGSAELHVAQAGGVGGLTAARCPRCLREEVIHCG